MAHTEFAITDVRVFNGENVIERASIQVRDGVITTVTAQLDPPNEIETIDGQGKTVIPGLIDAHTHAQPPSLEDALLFGATTELDMFSCPE